MQWSQEFAEKRLADMHMDDMTIVLVPQNNVVVSPDWFSKYRDTCHQFMRALDDSIESLAYMNLSQDAFMDLLMGRQLPENTSIRLRIPLILGGTVDVDNMFLCWTFPNSYNLDRFIAEQSGNDAIWLPNPTKKVYIPTHTGGGGDGGNATTDRMTQIGMSMGRDM